MPKRALKPVPKKADAQTSLDCLAAALKKLPKEKLVAMIVELAARDRELQRKLEADLRVHIPDDQLLRLTRQAIADATYYDKRDCNTNFDYDYAAYELVGKNFKRLVLLKEWKDVMQLSIELMQDGSDQAESSDEALMTTDIGDCLEPVIEALTDADLPNSVVVAWCDKMLLADKIGCICDQQLKSLRTNRT